MFLVCNKVYIGKKCQSSICMNASNQGFPAKHCPDQHTTAVGLPFNPIVHPGAVSSSGKWCTCTKPPSWCKRKCNSSEKATLFYCSIVQVSCLCAHCRSFWQWTGQHGHSAPYAQCWEALHVLTPFHDSLFFFYYFY